MVPVSKCLVLGGGGVTGIAWTIGVLAGLARRQIGIGDDCLLIGTSAGAVTGAELAHGVDTETLLARQLAPTQAFTEVYRDYSQQVAHEKNRQLMDKVHHDLMKARQKIGAFARRTQTPPIAQRRRIIENRLSLPAWPARPLQLTAVDVDTGERHILDARCGLGLTDAVMASCAVPGVWAPVPFQDRLLMDGGLYSMTNADLAAGHKEVIVMAPLGYCDDNPVSGHLRVEIEMLRQGGSRVIVLLPDASSRVAIGDNVLDPARRGASAQAGLAQGVQLAASLPAVWRLNSG
ncbi:patatin-like phospholipase family protein [Bordetella sp. 15P40C-2]|uniref:patatin-like phospholipase family protein n=1 Tax=Bordetella sp. 15P40C-2 TaxID=2572246 RepID=UPI0013277809|nr:patatin-like phospholipase family protein [Bordetella sp. 15P40C-2]MVW72814.1 patatin-like phospholipase family protein [Bordetella sp. 15P40C-2]